MSESSNEVTIINNVVKHSPFHVTNEKSEYIFQRPNELGADCQIVYWSVTKPMYMVKDIHTHNFPQLLCFFGTNPFDMNEFDAEVDLGLGENGDITVITKPTMITLPAGYAHCPLNFRVINKPIYFIEYMYNMPKGTYERNVIRKV
ncbi:MAG: hypothetical protein JW967_11535 [Dehalococcoidales bacterium]|nr:hypothetical protein [Dehalococcoidales bacterium]